MGAHSAQRSPCVPGFARCAESRVGCPQSGQPVKTYCHCPVINIHPWSHGLELKLVSSSRGLVCFPIASLEACCAHVNFSSVVEVSSDPPQLLHGMESSPDLLLCLRRPAPNDRLPLPAGDAACMEHGLLPGCWRILWWVGVGRLPGPTTVTPLPNNGMGAQFGRTPHRVPGGAQ